MKAIVYTAYGGPEVLHLKEIAKPHPRADEVLIQVYAVAINDWDWGLLTGDFINRLMYGLRQPKKQVLGSDVAGRIEAVGENVQKFQPGDEVFGDLSGTWGGFAEYVCAKENALAIKPPGMTFAEAASIPQAAMLAVQGLIDKCKIQREQDLLINGAGGGVGTFALQIAKSHGLQVTCVDSKSKSDMLYALGASNVIDYRAEDFTRRGQRYDAILDVKTNRTPFDYLRALRPGGIYATVGGSLGRLLQTFLLQPFIFTFINKRVSIVALKPNRDLAYICDLFEAGKLKPVIDGPYTLADVKEAMRHFGNGNHIGKVVITVKDV